MVKIYILTVDEVNDYVNENYKPEVYLTKKEARDAAALDYEKKQRNQRIAEIIAKKKDEALESKSIEELEKMLQE